MQSTPVPAWQLMFNQGLGWFDKPSSLFYTNMFDWMVDAVYFAMGAAGFPEMELLIGEVSRNQLPFEWMEKNFCWTTYGADDHA
jgi:hypothetical protein